MTADEIRAAHEGILGGLDALERRAVWKRALFGVERVDVRLLPVVERLKELRRRVAAENGPRTP